MALGFFNRKKKDGADASPSAPATPAGTDAKASAVPVKESASGDSKGPEKKAEKKSPEELEREAFRHDVKRAARFYQHARTTADSGQWDYSLEMFISGLRHDPDNLQKHKDLLDVARKRKVGGGKPRKIKPRDKTTLERMLAAEHTWANEIGRFDNMFSFFELAVEVMGIFTSLELLPVCTWIGDLTLNEAKVNEKTSLPTYLKLRDLYSSVGLWEQARESCDRACKLAPDDAQLKLDLKNIDAEISMISQWRTAVQAESSKEKGGNTLHITVRDEEKQSLQQDVNALSKTPEQISRLITEARRRHQESPEDIDLALKLVNFLKLKETPQEDKEAIDLLESLYKRTQEYKHRAHVGDIKIAQMARLVRQLKEVADKNPRNVEATRKHKQAVDMKTRFELQEYRDRVEHYPTDLGLKFEMGKRSFYFRQTDPKALDDAIKAFQDAQTNPRIRSQALQYLGACYLQKSWLEEAIATFRRAVELHPIPDDAVGMSLRYNLMDALEKQAREDKSIDRAEEARRLASQILQTDIGYRDIKDRVEAIKKLLADLRAGAAPSSA